MNGGTDRQRTKHLAAVIAVEYVCLIGGAYISFTSSFMGQQASSGETNMANFLFGCAFIAILLGWGYAAKLADGFWDLLLLELPLFAPIVVTGIVAKNEPDYLLSITCFALVIGLTLLGLRSIRQSAPSVETLDPWAEYIAPHLGAIRALAIGLIALVVVLGIGGAIVQRIHAPVTDTSLLASVLEEAGGSYTTTDDARCFDGEMVDWLCTIDDTSRTGAYDLYVDVEPGGSCWTATLSQTFGSKAPPAQMSGCVHRFPRGWSGVLGR